jgi:uncharacterized membrane protein YfcA
VNWAGVAAIGLVVGFLSGLFGKGGSAIATPLLHAVGVPAIVAVAAPLPATIPSTLAASTAYWRTQLMDREVLRWSVFFGVPATIAGALATRWISGEVLIQATDVIVAGLGLRFLLLPGEPGEVVVRPDHYRLRMVLVAVVVGISSGLLANSGGFILAPLYLAVLRLPIKTSFATSLAVASVLAVPGTVAHAALGHIDWAVVAVFGAVSVPLSYVGARVGLRMNALWLERLYGAALTILGIGFLIARG